MISAGGRRLDNYSDSYREMVSEGTDRIGWLADVPDLPGGAEFTQAEFRAAAPRGVEIVDCLPGDVDATCDRYVIHNCVQYALEDLAPLAGKPITKYWHDVGPWVTPGVREWLDENATYVCCSPMQAEYMGIEAQTIPPPVDLARYAKAAESVNGDRSGAVSVGSWRNYGKAPHKVAEWANATQTHVDFFGGGFLAPQGSREVSQEIMPGLLASYQTFVFLPTVIEPFGRVVAEAWAAGCEVVTNELVGAGYWIKEDPEAIETAAADFWALVLS
jgi:glycosyltransferase involved in cell wall biosynthesis